MFCGSGADWVLFKGRCLGILGRLEGRSFMARGDWGCDDMELGPEKRGERAGLKVTFRILEADLLREVTPYRRKTASAASSAPSGGGAAGAPGDLGSLWTPGPSEAAQSPAVAQATRA